MKCSTGCVLREQSPKSADARHASPWLGPFIPCEETCGRLAHYAWVPGRLRLAPCGAKPRRGRPRPRAVRGRPRHRGKPRPHGVPHPPGGTPCPRSGTPHPCGGTRRPHVGTRRPHGVRPAGRRRRGRAFELGGTGAQVSQRAHVMDAAGAGVGPVSVTRGPIQDCMGAGARVKGEGVRGDVLALMSMACLYRGVVPFQIALPRLSKQVGTFRIFH